jgi:hypothetical protein
MKLRAEKNEAVLPLENLGGQPAPHSSAAATQVTSSRKIK